MIRATRVILRRRLPAELQNRHNLCLIRLIVYVFPSLYLLTRVVQKADFPGKLLVLMKVRPYKDTVYIF